MTYITKWFTTSDWKKNNVRNNNILYSKLFNIFEKEIELYQALSSKMFDKFIWECNNLIPIENTEF